MVQRQWQHVSMSHRATSAVPSDLVPLPLSCFRVIAGFFFKKSVKSDKAPICVTVELREQIVDTQLIML